MLENLAATGGMTAVRVPKDTQRKLGTRAPKVTSTFLQAVPTGFATFIRDPVCGAFIDSVIGEKNDVAALLSELRHRLPPVVHTRAQLKRWIKDIWLPNAVHPVKRPASYWQRLGSVIWENYETAVDLRHRTKRAIKKEMERLAHADKRKRSKMLAARERRRRSAYASRQHAQNL
jgi:hypothetical protein